MECEKIDPSLIGFDIDGVVADTAEAFIRIAWQDYGVDSISPEDITDFNVEDCLPMDALLVEEIFSRIMEEPLETGLKPMPHAMVVLQEFSKVAPLAFVTARPKKEPIARWLKSILGDSAFKASRLVATGEHDGKAEYINELGLQYFVDDRLQTCLMLEKEGIVPIVYSQPWNRGRHDLRTVSNWHAIRELCV